MPWEKAYSPLISWRKINLKLSILSVSLVAHSCLTICSPMNCNTLGFPVHHQLPELTQTHINRVGDAMQPSHPLLSPFSSHLQSFPASRSFLLSQFFPSGGQTIGISALAAEIFSFSPSNKHSGLISFTGGISLQSKGLSSLLQHHSSKASIFLCSAFFMVLLSHPYMTTGKTVALSRWSFVSKVMSLLFNMLSRWVIAFLPRSKHLLISWLQSPSAAILEPPK